MKHRTKALVSIGAGAAGVASIYTFSKAKLNQGGYAVRDGAIMWSEDFEEGDPDTIVGLDGREHQIGSYGAINAAYSTAVKFSQLLGRTTRVVEGMLQPSDRDAMYMGFVETGRFPTQILNQSQRAACSIMVNCAVNFGQSLRVLATVCHHAGIERMYQPTEWERRRISLAWIYFASFLNPLAYHGRNTREFQIGVRQVGHTSGWMTVGMEVVTRWLEAYRNVSNIAGIEHLVRDFEQATEMLEPGSVTSGTTATAPTMGLPVAAIAWGIAVVIVAAGAVVVGYTFIRALTNYLFGNYAYLGTVVDQLEEALECARDPDNPSDVREECANQALALQEELRSYKPPLDDVLQIAGYAAVGLGTYWLYKKL